MGALFAWITSVTHGVLDTEKILIGVIIGLTSVIFGIVVKRQNKFDDTVGTMLPIIYTIKADVEHIKKNCPKCEK